MFTLFKKVPFAISFSDTHLQAVQLSDGNGQPKIETVSEISINPGVIKNGEILDKKPLSEAIKKLLQQAKPSAINQKECLFTFPENQSFEYVFYLSKDLWGENLKQELEKKISLTFPLTLAEISYDFVTYVFNTIQVVFVVMVKKNILQNYIEILKDAGLKPLKVEPESLSLLRNLVNFEMDQKSILIHFGNDELTWFLLFNGLVFDSNRVAFKDSSQLLKDLQKSHQYFSETTGQSVEKIFATGILENMESICHDLQVFLPVQECKNYQIQFQEFNAASFGFPIEEFQKGKFSAITGSALRNFEKVDKLGKINLFKS